MKANLGTRLTFKKPLVHIFLISSLLDHLFSSVFAIKIYLPLYL